MMHLPEGFTGTLSLRYANGLSVDICEVYMCNDDPNHLLLVTGDWVINGAWPLSYARKNNFNFKLVGYIDQPYGESYNVTLARFRDGHEMILDECKCCGNKSWRKKDEITPGT